MNAKLELTPKQIIMFLRQVVDLLRLQQQQQQQKYIKVKFNVTVMLLAISRESHCVHKTKQKTLKKQLIQTLAREIKKQKKTLF